jgi:HlyD family secretion protein
VAEIRVKEGDTVEKGKAIARLDTAELLAQLAGAKASVQRAIASISRAEADITIREAEHDLAEIEMRRAADLEQRAAGTRADFERRKAQQLVAAAQIEGSRAAVVEAKAAKEAAEAQVAQIEAMLEDCILRTPISGRVEYKLVQAGEVVAAGGRLVTILDLTDVYMTIFLPTGDAGRVALGSDARIILDAVPNSVFPATVSFVAAEAQFTPKSVETANEREKLMYRVKLAIDPKLLETYREYVKAGLTGSAYVQVAAGTVWPERLALRLPNVVR